MGSGEAGSLLPGATRRDVGVEGVRFALHRADPPRRRRTTPALLLHGVPETAAMWRDLLPELARDRVVLAPDLKGLGGSEGRGRYDVPTLAGELAALVLHEVDGPVDVVGHDWGGVLALGLAAARPDLVRRLVVANAPYRRLDPVRAAHVPFFALPMLPEAVFAVGGRRLVSAMLDAAWRSPRPLDPALRAHYTAAYADPARVRAMLGYYRASVRGQLGRALGRLTGRGDVVALPPVTVEAALVVWGVRDPVLPVALGEGVVRDLGPTARMLTVPAAGHFVVDEAPEVVVGEVAAFLREGERRPSRRTAGTLAGGGDRDG